jgi:hypothetical protein
MLRPAALLSSIWFSFACGLASGASMRDPTPVWVRSHNASSVDVYLLCGSHDARWLGSVGERGADAFEIAAEERRCAEGLNFFVVVRKLGRGYWVGPFRPRGPQGVQLVIEKYAGLSSAAIVSGLQ